MVTRTSIAKPELPMLVRPHSTARLNESPCHLYSPEVTPSEIKERLCDIPKSFNAGGGAE
jgi:hypothetical protein